MHDLCCNSWLNSDYLAWVVVYLSCKSNCISTEPWYTHPPNLSPSFPCLSLVSSALPHTKSCEWRTLGRQQWYSHLSLLLSTGFWFFCWFSFLLLFVTAEAPFFLSISGPLVCFVFSVASWAFSFWVFSFFFASSFCVRMTNNIKWNRRAWKYNTCRNSQHLFRQKGIPRSHIISASFVLLETLLPHWVKYSKEKLLVMGNSAWIAKGLKSTHICKKSGQ